MEERNVKIVRDPRKSLKSIKFNNFKNLSVTWFKENAWKWNFITLPLLITPESKLEHGGVGSFLKCTFILNDFFSRLYFVPICFANNCDTSCHVVVFDGLPKEKQVRCNVSPIYMYLVELRPNSRAQFVVYRHKRCKVSLMYG